jgi:hypothetical protein
MDKNYDLTKNEDLEKANEFTTLDILKVATYIAFPKLTLFFSRKPTIEQQADAAEKLIKVGRENNVDEIEIILSNEELLQN